VIAQVDVEAVLGEQAAGGGGRLSLAARIDVVAGEMIQELPGAVGGIAIHLRPADAVVGRRRVGVVARDGRVVIADEIVDEVLGDAGVPCIGRADHGVGDDLTVGVYGHMAFVTIETRADVLWPWRASGSTGEITRSLAARRAMRKLPSWVSSRSWPRTLANSSAASATPGARSWLSSNLKHAHASRAP